MEFIKMTPEKLKELKESEFTHLCITLPGAPDGIGFIKLPGFILGSGFPGELMAMDLTDPDTKGMKAVLWDGCTLPDYSPTGYIPSYVGKKIIFSEDGSPAHYGKIIKKEKEEYRCPFCGSPYCSGGCEE